MPNKSRSSRRWLSEHFSDPYVKKAQEAGYRSRAVYKLLEICERDHLFKPGMHIVELGAAPGGWSQLLTKLVGTKGKVIAVDLLPIEPIPGVLFIQGDFTEDEVVESLKKTIGSQPIDWVISDMAPNISGNASVDIPRTMYLAELALAFAFEVLHPQGGFLIKVFQGEGFETFLKELKQHFTKVMIRKPKASRDRSREIYLLATGFMKDKG